MVTIYVWNFSKMTSSSKLKFFVENVDFRQSEPHVFDERRPVDNWRLADERRTWFLYPTQPFSNFEPHERSIPSPEKKKKYDKKNRIHKTRNIKSKEKKSARQSKFFFKYNELKIFFIRNNLCAEQSGFAKIDILNSINLKFPDIRYLDFSCLLEIFLITIFMT